MRVRLLSTLFILLSFAALQAQPITNFPNFQRQVDSLYYATEYQVGAELLRQTFSESLSDSVTAYLHLKLGTFTLELAEYSEAEEELLAAKELYSKLYSSHHEIVASILSRLAVLCSEQGRFTEAVANAKEQFEDYKIEFGATDKFTALSAMALGEYSLQANDHKSTEIIIKDYAPIVANAYPPKSVECARLKKLEGNISFAKKEYGIAAQYYTAGLSALPPDRPLPSIRGAIELERARAFSILEKDKEALLDVQNAIRDIRSSRNAATSLIARSYLIAGCIAEHQNLNDSLVSYYSTALATYKSVTKENFRYTSERERLALLRDIKSNSGRVFSTVIRNISIYPKLAELGYDWTVFQKGLLLNSIVSIRSRSRTADLSLSNLLDTLAALHTRRSAFVSGDKLLISKPYKTIDSIDASIADIEKRLAKKSSPYARLSTTSSRSWMDVRHKLRPGSAAIEITTFPYFDGERGSDTLFYAAFVLPNGNARPKGVFPGSAAVLEDSAVIREYYRTLEHTSPRSKKTIAKLTELLWAPIASVLDSARTLYLSPDGIYCRISIPSLASEDKLLLDDNTITTLASTADLLRTDTVGPSDMVVMAGPNFGTPMAVSRKKSLSPLPATVSEARGISTIFQNMKWNVTTLLSEEASEENLRKLHRPNILHIATHGAFEEKNSAYLNSNELLRSTLYFTGANKTLSTKSSTPANDGILTALEATDLDLDGTSLVTLSACESGRGTIEPGEGVFGLPRAFRIAGASNVLMTLWRIPDKETAELMTSFYQNLGAGQSKPEALRNAQISLRQTIKKRYNEDIPLYWAGFVLIGF